jgi:hypothetical protein
LRAKGSRGPLLWPIAVALVGIALLLNNFLLLSGFNVSALWPLLLVLAGAQILIRGDLVPNAEARTFGITRGSVESATLEVSAGEIDVLGRGLQREGRLIAGQFAADSRPELQVTDTHAHLVMDRAATPWLAFANWEIGLTPDLPWRLLLSTSLGQVQLDLSTLIVQDAIIATGIGDIRLVCPQEAFGQLWLRSAMGDIHVSTPHGYRARVTVVGGRLFGIQADDTRYQQREPGVFIARDAAENAPQIDIHVSGTFGDAYLS